MPYKVVKQKDRYYVQNEDSGAITPDGGYSDEGQANDYLKALYANGAAAKGIDAPVATLTRRSGDCEFVPVRSTPDSPEITGYLALWGSPTQKDCLGTYFDKNNPPQMDLEFLPIPLRYGHGQDPEIGTQAIGAVDKVWLDDIGIPFHATLDNTKPFYQRVKGEIGDGMLATSSGTTEYLAKFADDGRFVSWPVAELSLTDKPCEFRMPAVAAIRSIPDHLVELSIKPIDSGTDPTGDSWSRWRSEYARSKASSTAQIRNKKMAPKPRPNRASPIKPAPTDAGSKPEDAMVEPAAAPAKRTPGLTLEMLGLDGSATIQDVWESLCSLVGDAAANAIMENMAGPGAEADEMSGMQGMLSERAAVTDYAPDPEADSRPGNFMGDETINELSNEGADGDATNGPPAKPIGKPITRQTDLRAVLQTALNKQGQALKPQQRSNPEFAELKAQNALLRKMLLGQPVDQAGPRFDRRQPVQPVRKVPNIQARDLQYDMNSAADLAMSVKMLDSVGKTPSESLIRAASYKIAQEIEKSTPTGSDMTVQYMTPFRSISEMRSMDLQAYRANEVMGDTNTNFGSNYIGVFYDTSLWLKTRAMPVWRMMEERGLQEKVIPVGYASDVIPLEGADFSWYRVPETVDVDATGRPKINIPASKAGTSSTTLAVKTLGALVYYSVLLEEDSIVPMASELNRKANIEVQEQIEYVLFNGDTATGTGNLNLKNGTVAASDVYNFTVADGMLKAAIIGNSGANARAAGGSFSDLDYQLLFGLLGNNGITGSDPTKLLYFVDPQTGLATDRLPIVKTKDINSAATVERGHATEMYAVPIWRSGQISLADSTGFIDSVTPANNKFGRILCVRPDQWVVGFKRQVTLEYFRDVPGQSNGMVITLRFGMANRDATQAGSSTFNLTVK